jgi:hypothetical protein
MENNYKIAVHGFEKGLNTDLSKFKYPNNAYYDAMNIHIVTDTGLSSGSVANRKGTKLEFKVPNLPSLSYNEPDGTTITIPALTNLKIIGGTGYKNRVIVFTNAEDSGITYGQIWYFEYDLNTDTIPGLQSGFLNYDYITNPIVHLMYNRPMNFNNNNRIQAWVREESDKFVRTYWEDGGLNQLRSFNLAPDPWKDINVTGDTNLIKIQSTPLSTINVITKSKLNEPKIIEVLNGNLPRGRVCYFYRLISRDGAITTFSPLSNMVDLVPGNIFGGHLEYPETYLEYRTNASQSDREAELELTSEKAIKVRFNNLDRNYDYIQCGYVHYGEKDLVNIYLFPESPTIKQGVSNAFYELIHDGLEETVYPLTLQEFTQISGAFEKPHTSVPKNNYLIVANTKAGQFNLRDVYADFDTRAFSYNNAGQAGLNDFTGSPVYSFTGTNYPGINEYLDSINPNSNTYIYQADGLTLGGQGSFIKYTFVTQQMLLDKNFGPGSLLTQDTQLGPPFIQAPDIGGVAGFDNTKSPMYSYLFASHARGEKYRYGLVAVDLEGRESFVEWIADIKIPEFSTFPMTTCNRPSGLMYGNVVGIKFEINLPQEIYDIIREIKIVRVERTEEHMTRLGTGVTGGFCNYRAHRITWLDVAEVIADLISEFIINSIFQNVANVADTILTILSATAWPAVKGYLASLLSDIIIKVLGSANTLIHPLYMVSGDDYVFKVLIRAAVYSIVNMIPIFGTMFTLLVGEQVTDYLYEKIKEFIKLDISNVGNNVYSLNNWNRSKYGKLNDGYNNTEYNQMYSSIGGQQYGYIISPIHQFDKYSYRQGDGIRIIGTLESDLVPNVNPTDFGKITYVYHRHTKTGIFNRTNSTAALRKWYDVRYSNDYRLDLVNNPIIEEKTLDVGEILTPNYGSELFKLMGDYNVLGKPQGGTIINAHIAMKERYTDTGNEIGNSSIGFSRRPKVMGIGDKKHLIVCQYPFPINRTNFFHTILDQQETTWGTLLSNLPLPAFRGIATYSGPQGLYVPSSGIITNVSLKEPRAIDGSSDYLVAYVRELNNQYGGASYSARSLNKYIEVETIDKSSFDPITRSTVVDVFKGDVYIGLYGAVNYNYYFDKFPGYEQAIESKKALGEIFPVEVPFNIDLREGKHFIVSQNTYDLEQTERLVKRKIKRAKRKSRRLGLDLNTVANLIVPDRFLYDEFIYDDVYHQQKSFKAFYPKPAIDIFTKHTTNRVWRSQGKIDGELIDSWRLFKPVDWIEVEGVYGPINKLAVLQDKLLFYQTNAIGTIITNERAAVTDQSGNLLQMATSQPFSQWAYITTESGAVHRFGVTSTNSYIYHLDPVRKKIFRFGANGLEPLSDIKGISALLRELIDGSNIMSIDNTLANVPIGVHSEYFAEYNTVLFTFLNGKNQQLSTTISFNQIQDEFDSRHSFTPGLYIRTPYKVLTSPQNNEGYSIFTGEYGNIFGQYVDSYITLITNGEKPFTIKTFDNYTLYTEVIDSANANVALETINAIECSNDYQTTGQITLTPSTATSNPNFDKIIRQERKWFINTGRDTNASSFTSNEARLRDFYIKTKFIYNNNNNKRFIMHNILTHYTDSQV